MRIAIVAIFKNEVEYILEWIAYHRAVIGINDFIIADNASNDGTTQLLEALDSAKQIKRIFFPRESETKGPQIPAYNYIIKNFGSSYDYFLFIDADEFLVNNTGHSLTKTIQNLESNSDFGGLALNWRIFGSSGNTYRQDGLVIEKFYRASRKSEGVNRHVKALVSTSSVKHMHIHNADLVKDKFFYNEKFEYATFSNNPNGEDLCNGNNTSPFTKDINNSVIYVAHFAVKSKAEHFFKKASRGSAGGLSSREKGLKYFDGHDLNQEVCQDLSQYRDLVYEYVQSLKSILHNETPYYFHSRVNIDNRHERLSGWIASDFPGDLRLGVLIDEKKELDLPLNVSRKDVFDKGLSDREICGFSYSWAELGKYQQSIRVWIKGNNFVIFES